MSQDRRKQVEDLFQRAADMTLEDRAIFLHEHCGDDADLRAEIERLLYADGVGKGDFLSQPLFEPPDDSQPTTAPISVPRQATHATSNLEPGVKVRYFGDYEILEEIDHGGMGVVYKARQVSLNRTVALKMIIAGQLANERQVKRFRAEAEAIAKIEHPRIVPIYEFGQIEGWHYFSMKLIKGGNLALHMPRYNQDLRLAARLMVSVAQAVHHAHQRGILHRDLKPTNILLDESGHPYVTDFGLAKHMGADITLTLPESVVGTPSYMSPEQAAGKTKELTVASDIYSLGAILFDMATGRPPFVGDTTLETIQQVQDSEPPSLRSINPKVDPDLEAICMKCLAKDSRKRYGTAEALAHDLERWLDGEKVNAPAYQHTRRGVPVVVMAAAALIAIAILLSWQLGWFAGTTKHGPPETKPPASSTPVPNLDELAAQYADALSKQPAPKSLWLANATHIEEQIVRSDDLFDRVTSFDRATLGYGSCVHSTSPVRRGGRM